MSDETLNGHGGDARSDDELLRELMALSAVDALDADDQAHLDVLIADRPDLQAEYADLRAAATTLAIAAADAPPAGLRASVLAAIADVPQLPPVDAPAAPPSPAPPSPALPPTAGAIAPVVPMRRRRPPGWFLPVMAAAAAAAIVVVAAVITRGGDGGEELSAIDAVLEDPAAVQLPFGGELEGLTLIYSAERGDAVVSGTEISAPDDEDVYALWYIPDPDDIVPELVDVFRPDSDGTVEVLLEDVSDPDGALFAVTVEAGPVEAPTSAPIATAALA